MEQRLSLITLAVRDLGASRRFYVDGLRWEPFLEAEDVLMIRMGEHLLLSLWEHTSFVAEVGPSTLGQGVAPITLAHNVSSNSEVDRVLVQVEAAGGAVVEPAARRDWGGYTGYAADPDGYRWEIAHAGEGPITALVVPPQEDPLRG